MIDQSLLQAVNSGQCVAFVGSGLSTQLGLPSWKTLSEALAKIVFQQKADADKPSYEAFLSKRRYPELFSMATADLGQPAVVDFIRSRLRLEGDVDYSRSLYGTVAGWPFAFYVTTNLDDLLYRAIRDTQGLHCSQLSNSKGDLATIHADTRDVILYLHGQVSGDPTQWVLTSRQYDAVTVGASHEYYRAKLRSIFEMFHVVIVGYSLRDPDIDLVLRTAKESSDPGRPIHMFLADITPGEASEIRDSYNIVVYDYKTVGDSHAQLRSHLRLIDRFTAPRRKSQYSLPARSTVDPLALPLFLYTRLQLQGDVKGLQRDLYRSIILASLHRLDGKGVNSLAQLAAEILLPMFQSDEYDTNAMQSVVFELNNEGFVSLDRVTQAISLSSKGTELVEATLSERRIVEEQVLEQAKVDLRASNEETNAEMEASFVKALREALVSAFDKRGIDIVASLCGIRPVAAADALDLFDSLKEASSVLETLELRTFFIEYGIRLLTEPTEHQKKYLWHLSQGFFAYHALRMDPKCTRFRLDELRSTVWLIDSSIILPFVARGCINHAFAMDVFERAKLLGLRCFTTKKLFAEVIDHFRWAEMRNDEYRNVPNEFRRIALVKPPYKQNLFVDGFVSMAADKPDLTFRAYLDSLKGGAETIEEGVRRSLEAYGVQVLEFDKWPGFVQEDYARVEEVADKIQAIRVQLHTFTRREQVVAEAEAYLIIDGERSGKLQALGTATTSPAYFVSQSLVLNALVVESAPIAWKAENFYRYLLTFPASRPSAELLSQCMLQDFYYAGVEVINVRTYTRFFEPQISQAKLQFAQIKDDYHRGVSSIYSPRLEEAYERTPDLEKPFFVTMVLVEQLRAKDKQIEALKLERAREVGEQKRRAESAEDKVRKLEKVTPLTEKERNELLRARAKRSSRIKRQQAQRRGARTRPRKNKEKGAG